MNVQRGDVVLVDYPYASGTGAKVRPVLVIQNDRDNQRLLNTIVVQITSVTRRALEPTQLLIGLDTPAGQQSGLRQDSVVNCINLLTLDKDKILRKLGSLPDSEVQLVNSQGKEVASSNSRASVYTCSDGCRRKLEYSRAELIETRALYERIKDLGKTKSYPSTLNPISQVEPTGTVVTADAVRALTRITYFVNSARDCSDLSAKVAHYSTCLEILFSTDSSEISHKLAERVALFLGHTFEERKRLFNRVKRLYSVRSKVVHGDVFSKASLGRLKELSLDADDLLRQLLRLIFDSDELCALFEGSKEAREEYFTDLVLQPR